MMSGIECGESDSRELMSSLLHENALCIRGEELPGLKQILFLDDDPLVLSALSRMLRHQRHTWRMTFLDDPVAAWERIRLQEFDVVVTDLNMPGLNGLQLLDRIRDHEETKDVQVIILTGVADGHLKRQALDQGATDLLNKPVEPEDLLARIRSLLRIKACSDQLKASNTLLETAVRKRTEQLYESRLAIVWRLAKAAELRDQDTGNHVIRVGCYSRFIAEGLQLSTEFVENLFLAAPLHDIGKIGIPDSILLKPGPLTPDEWETMKQHCLIGKGILEDDAKTTATFRAWKQAREGRPDEDCNPVLKLAASIAWSHHEKWDGSGYPLGLSGETIPLASRIVAIADVFDALTSNRPYKSALSEEAALEIIRAQVGKHFDPHVYKAFQAALDQIREVRLALADGPQQVVFDHPPAACLAEEAFAAV